MKYIFNRFLTVIWIIIIGMLILLSYISLFFIIYWIIFGRNIKEDLTKTGDYLSDNLPVG